jgi:hypothetical protein
LPLPGVHQHDGLGDARATDDFVPAAHHSQPAATRGNETWFLMAHDQPSSRSKGTPTCEERNRSLDRVKALERERHPVSVRSVERKPLGQFDGYRHPRAPIRSSSGGTRRAIATGAWTLSGVVWSRSPVMPFRSSAVVCHSTPESSKSLSFDQTGSFNVSASASTSTSSGSRFPMAAWLPGASPRTPRAP